MSVKTGIVMLNLGGPQTLEQVQPFLLNLFADREIIQLPFQNLLGPFIARRRTPHVQANYQAIGGGSPILEWTRQQGAGMVHWLDQLAPQSAPHKFYVAFRYVYPQSEDALRQMQADGVQRAVAFTQYPQFSCTTTGSSLNALWRAASSLGLEGAFRWSVIDRWPVQPGFIQAMTRSVHAGLEQFEPEDRRQALLLFSAHSLPLKVVQSGDPYPQEVSASVQAVMQQLGNSHPYLLTYQSAVGPLQWLGPSTAGAIRLLGRQGHKNILVAPIAFTSDHIETLFEIDLEYAELAHRSGIRNFKRAPALNDDPAFQRSLAEIVLEHLESGQVCSPQYALRCPGCAQTACRKVLNPIR